jgi:putative ABC transport system permease protein
MFLNYLAAALRNLWRTRAYAVTNVAGLTVGFAAAILIALYVRDEYSYDRLFPDYQRIYRVDETFSIPGRPPLRGSQTFSDIAELLQLDFPQLEAVTRLTRSAVVLHHADIRGRVLRAYWADANIFGFFPMKTLAGNLADSLSRPDGIVLTRKIARRYFGRENVAGETIELNGEHLMRVTAVIEDLPSNTHLDAELFLPGIASFSELTHLDAVKRESGATKSFVVYTYARLRPTARIEPINAAMNGFVARHLKGDLEGVSFVTALDIRLAPMADTHLAPRQLDAMKPQGDPRTLHIMIGVAVLILIVAGSNFVSMMTARAFHRSLEVGVRKAAGATRRQIIVQFMGECLFYATAALALAVAAVNVLLPALNAFLQRNISFDYFRDPALSIGLLTVTLLTGLAAGVYPSVVLARLRPNRVLKGSLGLPGGSGRWRQVLVVFQFATLIALIVVTLTIARQTRYALEDRLRLPGNQIYMTLGGSGCPQGFAEAATHLAGVRAASCSSSMALAQSHWGALVSVPHSQSTLSIESAMIDYTFFSVFDIKPLAGRLFTQDRGEDDILRDGDSVAANPTLILNESAVRTLGFTSLRAAVGQYVRWSRPELVADSARMTDSMSSQIVGVIPDFSIGSVRDVIEPTAYYIDPRLSSYALLLKLDGRTIPETMGRIKDLWQRKSQEGPFEGTFLSQYLQDLYADISREAALFTGFSSIAVVIAALGLLGLAVFTAERRTKEVALRKIMGARRLDMLRFLGWQFARPVFWANLLAWPCAYLFLQRWLEGFAYHVQLSPLTFVTAGALAIVIALATVAGHTLLVARAKPVEALRYE